MIVGYRKIVNTIDDVTDNFTDSDEFIPGGRIKHNRLTGFPKETIQERFTKVINHRVELLGLSPETDININIATLKEHGEVYIVKNSKNNHIYSEITLN